MRYAPLVALLLATMTRAQEPATTLRFEATGRLLVVQVDRELGVLVQAVRFEGQKQVWTRTGSGKLLELGRAWATDDYMPDAFATADGKLWAAGAQNDALDLREWAGKGWTRVAVAETPAVTAQRKLRRGAVHLGIAERIRAADGSEYLLDGFGVLGRGKDGAWSYAALQPLEAPPIRWSAVHWEPRADAVLFATEAGKRGLLARGGAFREVELQQAARPRAAAARVRFASGAWALFADTSVVVIGPDGATREHALSHPRPVLLRGADDRLLVMARGYPERRVVLDADGDLQELPHEQGHPLETPDPRNTGLDAQGRAWWWTRGILRRWDPDGRISASTTGCALLGIDPDQRAWFAHPGGAAVSLGLAELEAEHARPPAVVEVTEDLNGAAMLDAQGRLRLVRPVAGQAERSFAGAHQRIAYRWHVREKGAWVVEPAGPEYEVRFCGLRWCQDCHGTKRELPAPGKLETRAQGALDPEGRVLALDDSREARLDEAPLIRLPEGSTWLLGPIGLTRLEAAGDGRWRPIAHRLCDVEAGPWIQTAEGEVWIVRDRQLRRVAFPR